MSIPSRRPLRIAVDLQSLTLGHSGTATYITNLLPALLAVDASNHYLLLWPARSVPESIARWTGPRCSVVRLPAVPKAVWEFGIVPLALAANRVDVFHVPSGPGGLLVRAGRRPGVVVTLHDVIPLLFPTDYFRNGVHRAFYRVQLRLTSRADAVITVSKTSRDEILRRTAIPASKLTVIGEAVDVQFEAPPAPASASKSNPAPYILTIGGAEPRKNVATVIEAFARLTSTIPHRLMVAGGPWRNRSPQSLTRAGVPQDRIDFLGDVGWDELRALYAGADVFVFASLYEGFGLPVLEAMASGTPVVASSVGSLPEVADGAAILVDPTDPVKIAEAISRVLSNPLERNRLIQRGRERLGQYSWRDAAAQTLGLYERVAP